MTAASGQPLFPVNLSLAQKPVLVVGGGPVAARKTAGLVRAQARVTVVAPSAVDEIADDPDVRWQRRPYRRGEAASYRLVITATDDPAVNAQVHHDAEAANVFVNSADDPANCTFTLPAVVRRGDVQIAVSTNGRSPALASWLRRRLDRDLGSGYSALLDLLTEVRAEAKAVHGTSEVPGWEEALDDELLDLVRAGRTAEARSRLRDCLGLELTTTDPNSDAAAHPNGDTAGAVHIARNNGSHLASAHPANSGPGIPTTAAASSPDTRGAGA